MSCLLRYGFAITLAVSLASLGSQLACGQSVGLLAPKSDKPASNEKTDETSNEKTTSPTVALDEDLVSPRAVVQTFIRLANENDKKTAAKCLDLSGKAPDKAGDYVVKLKAILDRMGKIEFTRIPNEPDSAVGLDLGSFLIDQSNEDLSDAKLITVSRSDGVNWRFSSKTIGLIDEIYTRWREQDVVKGLAESKLKETWSVWLGNQFSTSLHEGHFLLPSYQWICLLALILIGFVADLMVRIFLQQMTKAWFRVIKADKDFDVPLGLWKPVGLLTQALVWYGGTTLIGLPDIALIVLLVALKLFTVVAAIWTAFRFVDLLSSYLARKALKTDTKFDDLLIPLLSRSLKVFAVCMGLITCAQAFSIPISGLLGGLGLGGMALALASKDTIANLFGSLTVLVDRPFEVGDWIITEGVEGSVETVGFRSTRVRTFYNSLITVPNSMLTTATVDNMGRRQYRRIRTTLGVQYDTTPEQIEAFCEGIRELIRRHPYTRKDYYHVYFNQFSSSSLDIMLYCFIECPDWSVELRERHRLFSDILRLAQELHVAFAFPTQTLHMVNEQGDPQHPPEIAKDPTQAGQQFAAQIAGPLVPPERRPGMVPFTGPSQGDLGMESGGDE